MQTEVLSASHPGSELSAAPLAESTELAEGLAKGRDVLDDIRSSLDSRHPSEGEEEPEADLPPLPGAWIAFAAFVPAFLLVFMGLSYVLPPASNPSTSMTVSLGSTPRQAPLPEDLDKWVVSDVSASSALTSKVGGVEPKRVSSVSADSVSWVRAAAFADGHAADELGAAMRGKGYRVDIRLEDSATLPWVVWVSKLPASRPRASE